ncbi:MAG TPA: hypothetical protein VG963_12800 [Polyangiaceae bacterium]|nr:hypothetical protein [Polyangiaceae bacterium]
MAFPRRRPHVAGPDEVRITRDGDAAIIEYGDPNIATTQFTIGAEKLATMTDADILALWNDGIEATDELRRSLTYVATEVPVGEPQLRPCELSGELVTRGDIVRCIIEDRPENADDVFVSVDGMDLTLLQFAKMLGTYTGWGMRIEIVPDDELHLRPKRRVRVPKKNQRSFIRHRA